MCLRGEGSSVGWLGSAAEVIQTPDQAVSRALYLGTLAGRISYPTWPGGPEDLGLCLGKGHDLHSNKPLTLLTMCLKILLPETESVISWANLIFTDMWLETRVSWS